MLNRLFKEIPASAKKEYKFVKAADGGEGVLPDIRLIAFDETEHWDKEFLSKYPEILKIFGLYVFDANMQVHVASVTPSYELTKLGDSIVYSGFNSLNSERFEEIETAVSEASASSDAGQGSAEYVDVSVIQQADPDLVEKYGDSDETDSDEAVEKAVEFWSGNQPTLVMTLQNKYGGASGSSNENSDRGASMGMEKGAVSSLIAGAGKGAPAPDSSKTSQAAAVETKDQKVARLRAEAERRKAERDAAAAAKTRSAAPAGTDENGTPPVGGAPDDDPAGAQKPAGGPAPTSAPVKDGSTEPVASSQQSSIEDSATALVKVNEKISEIEKRSEVDKVVLQELQDIKETLTGVTASIRADKKAAASKNVLSAAKLTEIVSYLDRSEKLHDKVMLGFEAKASITDPRLLTIISKIRAEFDSAVSAGFDSLKAWKEGKASVSAIAENLKNIKAAADSWDVVTKTLEATKAASKTVLANRNHVKGVLETIASLVESSSINASDIPGKTMEWLDMQPEAFKSCVAFLNKEAPSSGVTAVPSVQSLSSGGDDIESMFNE